MQRKEEIPLGDLVQKISLALYEQLANLMKIMPAQTPELRAQKLKQYFAIARSRLENLQVICQGLYSAEMKTGLKSLGDQDDECCRRRFETEQVLNAMYFFHAELYPKRIRSLDVDLAKEILARNAYPYLPEAIFTDYPGDVEAADVSTTLRALELHIKAKLALEECIPPDCDSVELIDGVLILQKSNLFKIALTLAYLDKSASWKPLNFKLNMVFSHEGLPQRSVTVSNIEFKVFDALLRIYFSTISPEKKLNVPLMSIWSMCYHMSLSYALRMFYIQTLLHIRSSSAAMHETNFIEEPEQVVLVYRFWKSSNPSFHRFEQRISVSRQQFSKVAIELFMLVEDGRNVRIKLPDFCCSLDEAIRSGNVIFLYECAMKFCSQASLQMLYDTLSSSESVCRALEKGLRIHLSEETVELSVSDVKLAIFVDSRNGTFTLVSSSIGLLGVKILEETELFMHEINQICYDKSLWCSRKGFDIVNEVSEKSSVLSSNKPSNTLTTVASIVQTIAIAFFHEKIKSILGVDVLVATKNVDGNMEKVILIPLHELSEVDHKYVTQLQLSLSYNLTLTVYGIQSRVKLISLYSEAEILQHHRFDFSRHLKLIGSFSELESLIPFLLLSGKTWVQSL